jgi:ABC-type uncharacterized transport system permease subunit
MINFVLTYITYYFIRMFIKDPTNRPSAAQVLETPFIKEHREV